MSIKYIFCINSGRNGSEYLTKLLSEADNTVSIHEGSPIMNGSPMEKFNNGDSQELETLMPLKMREILKLSKNGRKIYCESNHSFIKGWGYLLPDKYIPQEEIGVIILRRDIDRTAYSLLRIHNIPSSSEWAKTWLLTSNAERNLSKPSDHASPYELCQWYAAETYLRAEEYKKMFPRIKYVECDLEQLNNYNFVLEMFSFFGLSPLNTLQNTVGKVCNSKNQWPKLSLKELSAKPIYPSADNIEDKKRDALIAQMVNYLQEKKADRIAQVQPDYAHGGTFLEEATRLIIESEQELEEVFECSLIFTETERILMWELLRTINPKDISLIHRQRHSDPVVHYTYDFNQTLSLGTRIKKQGLLPIARTWLQKPNLVI
jgi:hypothetical protein